MNLRLITVVIILLCGVKLSAQKYERTKLGIKLNAQGIDLEVQFYSPKIVRILRVPVENLVNKESLSVVKKAEITDLTISKTLDVVTIKSSMLKVAVNLSSGKVSFFSLDEKPLFTEKDYGAQFTNIRDVKKSAYAVRQAFVLDKDEVIYGLGQQPNGRLNQRNQKVYLRQENTKICIPFFQSTKGYGLFWDNYSPTTFTDNAQETAFDSEIGNCSDYYFMFGNGADGVVALMRDLTGQAPMMPLWVYGFIQSKERYKNQFELVDVVRKYRELKVPLDGIVQDWQYWGPDSNWNAMSFAPKIFPRPKAMVDSIHNLNAHLFIVSWPGFAPKTAQYKEFDSKKMLINFDTWPPGANTKPYDVYNPTARNIYWDYLNKGIFSLGIDAWWLDSTEPDHINLKDQDFDQPTALGSYRSVHNAFPLEHTKGVYENQRKTSEAKRVVLLTRSAFAGQQRYSTNTWSGDTRSDWPTFKTQITNAISFSLSGLPYWNADIGGFFAGSFRTGGGAKNPDFQELYTRWMQFATFTPMMRSHGTDIPREIYQFGQPGDKVFDTQAKFINMRYSLLPYIYSTAWNVTNNGGSFIRSLYSAFPNDSQGYQNNAQFMFGNSFLVVPVTDKGKEVQAVYLPKGTAWYDFWTNEKFNGSQTIEKSTPIDILPLYVKAGSIFPVGPKAQYATEKKWDNLQLRIYPGADGDFTLYEDEFDNYNYEKGAHSEITFKWNDQERTLIIMGRKGNFAGMLQKRKFDVIIVGSKLSKSVSYSGKLTSVEL